MKNKKFDDFYLFFCNLKTDEERLEAMKDFMLNCSGDELRAWNRYMGEQSKAACEKITIVTDEDRAYFKPIFDKIDALIAQIKHGEEQRRAA